MPGAIEIDTTRPQPDITQPLKSEIPVCTKLLNFRDFMIGQRSNLVISVTEWPSLNPGQEQKFVGGGGVSGTARVVYGIAVSYQLKAWGYFPVWPRNYVCRELEMVPDAEGHVNFLPYP
jgi:hypothetical protein